MSDVLDVRRYYDSLMAVDIGGVADDLLGARITARRGQTLHVDCPRHTSISHASLHIWLDRQGWYCHGCGVGGDVLQLIEFVQSGAVTRGVRGAMPATHRAARDWLAARLNLAPLAHCGLSAEEIAAIEASRVKTMRAWECLTALTTLYHERLLAHADAQDWLAKQYAFGPEVVSAFRLGLADNTGVLEALLAQGFTHRDLYACGAYRPDPHHDEIAYPTFDGRLVFPYLAKGHTVYMIGRRTPWTPDTSYEQAKYKKLPVHDAEKRTYIDPAIDNGVLFNEDVLTQRPQTVIITEGITDCITLAHHGFSAISPVTVHIRQADWGRLIPKLAAVPDVVLCQDNEVSEAGWRGALRTAHHLAIAKLRSRIATLPLDAVQQEARQELTTRFGWQPGEGSTALGERLASQTNPERLAAQLLVERAKQDVCGYFVAGHTADEFRQVIADAQTPIEYAIAQIPDDGLTPALLNDIVSPILAAIAGLPTLEQTPLLARVRAKLGKDAPPMGELRRAMRAEVKPVRPITHHPTPVVTEGAPPMTDLGNAERLIAQHQDKLMYCSTSGSWLVWDGCRWTRDNRGAPRRLAHETARSILTQEAATATDGAARDAWVDWQRRSESAHATYNMLQQAMPYLSKPASDFDADPWLLNVRNGTIDLRTGELRPHRREDLIRKLAPVDFDPDASTPLWSTFLFRIFDGNSEVIEYIQRAVGYSLTGDVSCQCLFFMYGPTAANGKSTFVNTLTELLGDYLQKAPTEMLMHKPAGATSVPNDLAVLQGARLAVASELDAQHRFSESRIKDMTGGDPISARFLYGEYFTFAPTHKLWIYGNYRPTVPADDAGFWRRVHLIPFEVQIPEHERVGQYEHVLRVEHPGILAWAVRGCLAWQERGGKLDPPSSIRDATEEYRSEGDKLAQFLGERCLIENKQEVQAKALYEAYVLWCGASHETPVSNTAFGRALTARGFAAVQRRTAVYRQGLALRVG